MLFSGEIFMSDRLLAVVLFIALCGTLASARHSGHARPQSAQAASSVRPLKAPANGTINVAFIISQDTEAIDLAGPWEVFQDVMFTPNGGPWRGEGEMVMPFNLYTVSESLEPLSANGLILIPSYTFDTAPQPQVIVIPAQGGRSAAQKAWLLANSKTADVTMSVCTGASMLAAYGLLDNQKATTHHMSLKKLQAQFPAVKFVSGTRYVENEKISTARGLTSGIDLALHVVERYYGRETAQNTADYLEYGGEHWKEPQFAEVREVAASN
jgi:transcriptional regulator GlxA family with amidase domain